MHEREFSKDTKYRFLVLASAGGMGEVGSAVEMGRLKAPVRDKPGVDQHQRRALRPDLRDIDSVIKRCSAAGRLRVTKRRLNRSAQAGD